MDADPPQSGQPGRAAPPSFPDATGIGLRVAAVYAVAALAWILFSDQILAWFVADAAGLTRFQTVKGVTFVLVTSLLLAWVVRRHVSALHASNALLGEQRRQVASLNRIHEVLEAINSAILRIRDRQELLDETCRIAVGEGRFPRAWVGMFAEHRESLRRVSAAGGRRSAAGRGNREGAGRLAVDGSAGLAALAAGEGPYWVGDTAAARAGDWLCAEADDDGYRSLLLLPLGVEGETVGVLALYSHQREFFGPEERRLLEDLAADAGLGLEHIDKERRLDAIAHYDPVTGFPNRSLFLDRLGHALDREAQEGRTTAVLALGIDHEELARINFAFGRGVGDAALRDIGERLESVLRDRDTVARLSGHEFGLLLEDLSQPEDAAGVAVKVMDLFPLNLREGEADICIQARAGGAVYPEDGRNALALLEHAEMALRGSIHEAPGICTFYTPDLDGAYRRRQTLERELRSVLNRDELSLAYQPVVDLASGRVVAVEALLRWRNPALGEVSPAVFVPLAEDSGLIVAIGAWALGEACRQLGAWREAGIEGLTMAVNVSARQLLDPELVAQVEARTREAGFAPDCLALEVTETAVIQDVAAASVHLSALRDLGIKISIDDFGTGYASLSYLSRLPAQQIKIDRTFLHAGADGGPEVPVIRAVISLGESLGLAVVAEGVETAEQLALLRRLGCPFVQGNAIAPALPGDRVPEVIRSRERPVQPA